MTMEQQHLLGLTSALPTIKFMVDIINYNSNTGKKLNAGESFLDKATGQTMTQGNVFSPAIITSKAATNDLNNIKTNVTEIASGITNQATKNAQTKLASEQKAIADAKEKTLTEQKDKELSIKEQALTAGEDGTTEPVPTQTDDEKRLAQAEENYFAEAENVRNTILNIQNGTVPLSAGEQAQIAGLEQQYNALIDEQKLINKGATGTANIRGYQTGSAQYDPTFQVKTIGAIVTAGFNKVADLNTKMASAVAELTQGFKDNKISAIKDAWTVYSEAANERKDTLEKTVERTNKLIDDARKEKLALEKEERDYNIKVEENIDSIASEASQNGAPLDVIAKIGSARSVNEAIQLAGEYSRDPLEDAYKKAQISKIYQDIADAQATNSAIGDPNEIIAYAQQYASTGTIPTGMPKGTFGVISSVAKELPKQEGEVLDAKTGVKSSSVPATVQDDFATLYNIKKSLEKLKKLDEERIGGVVSGTLGKVFGSDDQANYLTVRKGIVDDIQRMQSGAALTEEEQEFYKDYLPGRYSESFGFGQDSKKKIENFESLVNDKLANKAKNYGLPIYGFSKVQTPAGEKTVGETIVAPNGTSGRVNADGSITLLTTGESSSIDSTGTAITTE